MTMARKRTHQRGSVVLRQYVNCKAFVIRYRVRRPGGGWSEKSETLKDCPNKKSALKTLEERLKGINGSDGDSCEREEKRFSDLFAELWPQYLDNNGVKPSTRKSYDSELEKWIKPYFGQKLFGEIKPQDVANFMARLSQRNLSPKYRKNVYNLLKLLFEIAVEYEFTGGSPIRPKIHRPKVARGEKSVFSADQGRAILQAADPFYRAPLATLAMTGVRAGELLGLQWQDIDFLGKRIRIARSVWRGEIQTTKTEASEGTIAMPDQLAEILLECHRNSSFTAPGDYVFCKPDGSPMDPDSLRRYGIYPALEKAGIPFRKRASGCHAFRHLAGSIIHRETGSLKLAQKQLRHSDISTTGNIYTHVEEMDQVASILGRAFGNSVVGSVVGSPDRKEDVQ